jgi:hypothetical protein
MNRGFRDQQLILHHRAGRRTPRRGVPADIPIRGRGLLLFLGLRSGGFEPRGIILPRVNLKI